MEFFLAGLHEAMHHGIKLLPFLFLTYIAMGLLEKAAGSKAEKIVTNAGNFGPLLGGIIGAFPQCGFSAAASNFYVGRVITLGTLISIYLSTSDEMLPMLISEHVEGSLIFKIIGVKVVIGIISGIVVELFLGKISRKHKIPVDHTGEHICCHCHGHDGIIVTALKHSIKVFIFIFLVSVVINTIMEFIGHENLYQIFSDLPIVGEMIAALVGLIPNCAASVVITQLYLEGIIGAGPMMAGLLVSAGIGLLVLFEENHSMKENFTIVGILYVLGVVWGVIIETLGILAL